MKQILLILFSIITISCKAKIYPLNTSPSDIPENAYEEDTNNEFPAYEGNWKGTWNNKIIYITFKKVTKKYDNVFKYYRD